MHMAKGNDSTAGPSPTVTASSILGKLSCSQPVDISRKRKVSVNPHVASVGLPGVVSSTEVCFSVAAHVQIP